MTLELNRMEEKWKKGRWIKRVGDFQQMDPFRAKHLEEQANLLYMWLSEAVFVILL